MQHPFCEETDTNKGLMLDLLRKYDRMLGYKRHIIDGYNSGGDSDSDDSTETIGDCDSEDSEDNERGDEKKRINETIGKLKLTSKLSKLPGGLIEEDSSSEASEQAQCLEGIEELDEKTEELPERRSYVDTALSPVHKSRGYCSDEGNSQLFTKDITKFSFAKIFSNCPLDINCASSWKHPDTGNTHLLFATKEGIYSLLLKNSQDVEMVKIFTRECRWVYVFRNLLLSLSDRNSHVYMHNLISLHKDKKTLETYVPRADGVAFTMKIPGTGNTLKCCVETHPANGDSFLYLARTDSLIVMQWYEPLQRFMIQKEISTALPPELTIFEPVTRKGDKYPRLCIGAFHKRNDTFEFEVIEDSEGSNDEEINFHRFISNQLSVTLTSNMIDEQIEVKTLKQLDENVVMVAYDKSVHFVDVEGTPLALKKGCNKLSFDFDVKDVVCLGGNVLNFHDMGVQGRATNGGRNTLDVYDMSNNHKLLCAENIIVFQRYLKGKKEISSDLYVLLKK